LFGNFTGTFASNVSNATDGYTIKNNVANGLNISLNDGYYIWNVYCYNETAHGNFYNTSNFSITVDNTTPVIRNLNPADDSYIYGTSTQLFQANLTELNLNTTATNVTLYYRKCSPSCGAWASSVTNCYANPTAPNYVCNITLDLYSLYAEGNIIQFLYNVSDKAGNTGANGTEASPNNVTIDRTAPGYSNVGTNDTDNTIGTNVGLNITAYWTDAYSLGYAILSTNETGAWANKTANYSSTMTMSGVGYWTNFTWKNTSMAVGTVVGYKVYANDSVGNQNVSSEGTFTLDGTAPRWSANTSSIQTVYSSSVSSFNVTWTDNVGLAYVVIEGNWSGSAKNYTMTDLTGGSYVYNYNTTLPAGTLYWKVYANDTSGTENKTDTVVFSISRAPTSIRLYLNGTEGNRTYNVGDPYNFTAAVNITGKNVNITANITGFITNYTTTPIRNESTVPTSPGFYNITGFFVTDTNYSASQQDYFVTVYGWANTTTTLNTSWVKQGEAINVSCNVTNSNSSAALVGYSVQVLNGTTSLTTGLTNTKGGFNYEFTPQNEGSQTIKCAIYDNTTNYYNVSYNATADFTSDFTLPVLSNPTPTNGSYIYGTSAQLFQITVTDTNFNTSSNATLYYKILGGGAWTSVTLQCSRTSPHLCNKTIDLSTMSENDVIQFFFNASDNATNVGEFGNAGTPNITTLDRSAPTYTNNASNSTTVAKNEPVLIYAQWADNYNLGYAWLATNETGTWANRTANYSSPVTLSGTSAWSNFTWNASIDNGMTIAWRIYANDSAGNENVTSNGTFTIDGTKPQFWNNNTNVTQGTIAKDAAIYIYFNWTDNVGLAYAWLETNETGTWANKTGGTYSSPVTLSGRTTWSNFTWKNTSVNAGTVIHMRVYANDTSGNVNGSFDMKWTIDNTVPTWSQNLTNITNGTTIPKGTVINLTTVWTDDTRLHKYWCWDSNSSVNATAQSFDLSVNTSDCIINTASFAVGRFYATIYANDTSSNQNVTGNFSWVIDNDAPNYANETNSISGEAVYLPSVSYTLNISWTDDLGDGNVSKAILEWNGTTNYTSGTNPTVLSLLNSNFSITLTDLSAQNYTYKWFANDTSGNWNLTSTYTLNITQNTTNPITVYLVNSTTTVTNGNMSISAGNTVTVNGTFGYSNAGTMAVYSNVTTGNISLVNVGSPYTTLSSLAAGVYKFVANTTGTVNYTSNATGPGTFYLTVTADTTRPTVTVYHYMNGTAKKSTSSLMFNVSVSDATGVNQGDSCNITINSVTNRTLTISGITVSSGISTGWCNGTITVPSVVANGNYTINITVNDNSTNKNEGYNDSYVLTIDNTTPVITVTLPPNGVYNKSDSSGYIWINGTVYDNLQMGTGNLTINSTYFNATVSGAPYFFNGTLNNNTAFSFRNTSMIPDGYIAVTINYTDNATNTGQTTVYFYVDNTPPSSAVGLKNSSLGRYQPSSAQVIQVSVTDALKTNGSITLNYRTNNNQTWLTQTMSGTAGTTTAYSTTIDTSGLINDEYVLYYISGIDNATNSITAAVGGSSSSPLANITIDYYCGNNGTDLAYCSCGGEPGQSCIAAINKYRKYEWATYQLSGTSLTEYNISTVLNSISGKYSGVYHRNISSTATPWLSYNPSIAWNLNTLRFGNNTDTGYYINVTAANAVIRIA